MKFDLRRPCENCPFRTDCTPGWLGEPRAAEIAADVIMGDKTFACHKTTRFGENADGDEIHVPHAGEQHCAGALLVMQRANRNGNAMVRIARMFGLFNPAGMDESAPVFDSAAAFIEHHSEKFG